MSCERFEHALALEVTGDLPGPEAEEPRAHLAGCSRCRVRADRLARDQAALRALAEEDVAEAALRRVRARVKEAVSAKPAETRWSHPVTLWVWAAAAGLALVVVGLAAWRAARQDTARSRFASAPTTEGSATSARPREARAPVQKSHPEPRAAEGTARPTTEARAREARASERRNRAAPTVIDNVRGPDLALERALQRPERLSRADADQLARALAYVSKLDRVPTSSAEDSAEAMEAKAAPLMQIVTDDPNVVIYWQIDSNGG